MNNLFAPPIVGALLTAARDSANALGARVANVKYTITTSDAVESIQFDFDGKLHIGELRGRNRNLVVGFGDDADKAIAIRVLLDGHAKQVSP
jgi:hypothetical protein